MQRYGPWLAWLVRHGHPPNKFAYIDALRGIAILMVVMVHTSQHIDGLNGGIRGLADFCQLGVQLFFVASALTLCFSFRSKAHEPLAIESFFIRRFFRIAPLYYLAIPLYFCLWVIKEKFLTGSIVMPAQYSPSAVLGNVFFIHDFMPSAQNNIVPGGWSIGVEMAFYALFPAIFTYFAKYDFAPLRIIVAIVAVTVLDVGTFALVSSFTGASIGNQSFAYYSLLNQLPVFLIGILAFKVLRNGVAPRNAMFTAVVALLCTLIFLNATILAWSVNGWLSLCLYPVLRGLRLVHLQLPRR